ncbi:MAG: repressor LexA [Chloroflexi bacterium]|nr:repressor LexA [Chloroflexota bacterium]
MARDTRQRILSFIRDFVAERGYAPTVRDIVKGCHISTTSVVQHHLNRLEKDGQIQRDPQVFRSIRLADRATPDLVDVPLLGTIAAGEPIPVPTADSWTTMPQDILRLTQEMTQGKRHIYALKVKGTSMIDALIDDGDIVLMQATQTANDGDMVAVWLKDRQEVTLKKIYREPGRVILKPANQTMSPIYTDPDNIEIQGKVIWVLRRL